MQRIYDMFLAIAEALTNLSVHVMQRGDCADQLEAFRRQVGGAEVANDVPDATGLGMVAAALDTRLVAVQADDLRNAATMQLTGEFTVAAADVECPSAAVGNDIEHHRLVPGTHGSEA